MDDVVRDFLVESHEGLDRLDRDLVVLEQAPSDRARLARIFQCIHTVKGTGGLLGFSKLEGVSHPCRWVVEGGDFGLELPGCA